MSTFLLQDVLTSVRDAVQDTSSTSPRYSDAMITRMCNQTIKRIALLRPDLFAYVDPAFACVAGARQTAPADSFRILEVLQITGGNNLNEINRESYSLLNTGWQSGAPGPATEWMRHVRNPNLFFLSPPSSPGQILTIEYAQSPRTYAISEAVALLADAYFPCVVDGVVWLLESVDNEHVNSGRAKMFQDSFMQLLGLTVQTKPIMDQESGGEDPKMVY